jgi:hypothetical protein
VLARPAQVRKRAWFASPRVHLELIMNLGISRDTAFMPSQHIRRDIQHIFLLQTSAHAALAFAPPNVAQRKRKTHSFRRSLGIAQHSPTQRADSNTHDSVFVLRPLADAKSKYLPVRPRCLWGVAVPTGTARHARSLVEV